MVLRTSAAAAAVTMVMVVMTTTTTASSPGCPAGCACKWKNGKQTVECVNKKVTGVTAALGIDPATQVLNISDNDLSAAGLPRDTFAAAGLSNLQRIYAARCNVYYVHDAAFRGLTNLVELDLSGNCLRSVPQAAFAECPSLMKLNLAGNPIGEVPAHAFRHLGQLTTLDLSGCGLTVVEADAFDELDGLDLLRLGDNRLTHVPGTYTLPIRLHGVDLHRNNWQCDCRAVDLQRWLIGSHVPVTEEPVCSGPAAYKGVPVRRVPEDELACAPVAYPDTRPVQDVPEGANVSFRCLVAGTPAATVEWLFGGAPVYRHNASELITVDGNTTAELYVYNASVGDAGAYACVAENRAGRARANFTVTVRPRRPSAATGPVDDRSAPSQSSSAAAGGSGSGPLLYVACLVVGAVAVFAVAIVLVAIRCKRSKRGGRSSGGGGTDGYRAVSTTADKEPPPRSPTAAAESTSTTAANAAAELVVAVTTATAATMTMMTTVAAAAADFDGDGDDTTAAAKCNPDVVSDAKRAGWEIDFEQIVWAECPPATGYVSIQIPVQCGIECLGAYYAAAAAGEAIGCGGGTLNGARRQRRRAAVLAAYDDTARVPRTTAQGCYPTAPAPLVAPPLQPPPAIVVDDDCGAAVIAPIISPPLPFRSAAAAADDDHHHLLQYDDDSIAL